MHKDLHVVPLQRSLEDQKGGRKYPQMRIYHRAPEVLEQLPAQRRDTQKKSEKLISEYLTTR